MIRKDLKINKNNNAINSQKSVKSEEFGENTYSESEDYTISNVYVFRCGKVGPCDSLSEVLL